MKNQVVGWLPEVGPVGVHRLLTEPVNGTQRPGVCFFGGRRPQNAHRAVASAGGDLLPPQIVGPDAKRWELNGAHSPARNTCRLSKLHEIVHRAPGSRCRDFLLTRRRPYGADPGPLAAGPGTSLPDNYQGTPRRRCAYGRARAAGQSGAADACICTAASPPTPNGRQQ